VPGIAVFVSVGVSVAVGGVPVTVDVAETVGVVVALVTEAVGVPRVPVTVTVNVVVACVASGDKVGLGVVLGVTGVNGVAGICSFKRAMVVYGLFE
jgi:hypothetical protein